MLFEDELFPQEPRDIFSVEFKRLIRGTELSKIASKKKWTAYNKKWFREWRENHKNCEFSTSKENYIKLFIFFNENNYSVKSGTEIIICDFLNFIQQEYPWLKEYQQTNKKRIKCRSKPHYIHFWLKKSLWNDITKIFSATGMSNPQGFRWLVDCYLKKQENK